VRAAVPFDSRDLRNFTESHDPHMIRLPTHVTVASPPQCNSVTTAFQPHQYFVINVINAEGARYWVYREDKILEAAPRMGYTVDTRLPAHPTPQGTPSVRKAEIMLHVSATSSRHPPLPSRCCWDLFQPQSGSHVVLTRGQTPQECL
jgi:hypothetical protein